MTTPCARAHARCSVTKTLLGSGHPCQSPAPPSAPRSAPSGPPTRSAPGSPAPITRTSRCAGPFLLPAERRDLAAVYAFCRTTDDLGDEVEGDRSSCSTPGRISSRRRSRAIRTYAVPVLVALARTAGRRELRADLFLRLIEANRRDQIFHRYADRADLLEYCELSATPSDAWSSAWRAPAAEI